MIHPAARFFRPLFFAAALSAVVFPGQPLLVNSLVAQTTAAQSVAYGYDPAGRLATVTYGNGRILTYSYDPAGNLVRTLVTDPAPGSAPVFTADGVVNSANYARGAISPGELVAIFGSGFGTSSLVTERITPLGFFDNYLAETSVTFDGVASPLVYVIAGQLSAVVPYSVEGRSSTQVVVQYQGLRRLLPCR